MESAMWVALARRFFRAYTTGAFQDWYFRLESEGQDRSTGLAWPPWRMEL
ncbi:hypothetical protein LFAB_01145 [Lactiplantibacillus fabifermentans T30PCM01]|uniref:Uncharacterized protein n=1 Tax=Lactiplantibacillus fabifermentans T30PCM01 TaxID=1400520 RepID=W6TAK8_9LACO|nr:hypothetical protein LFAB_01145 [Lactiplantibacillus fabifermentans T30PCM01]